MLIPRKYSADFGRLVSVFKRQPTDRPVLFEFAFNDRLVTHLSGLEADEKKGRLYPFIRLIHAFHNGGFDYVTVSAWRTNTLAFPKNIQENVRSRSLDSGNLIVDRATFETYPWPDPESGDYALYGDIAAELPEGMKIVASSNGGLLENVIDICGFENISMMMMLEPDLAMEIFDAVGSRLLRFYEIVSSFDTVGALIMNDDWGFKNQTMFSPEMLRQFVFPWHRKMVEAVHARGKFAILHSCGDVRAVMDDVINDMKYDAKHSYEDQILPVEDAYDLYHDRIAVLGGVDMDFLARRSGKEITARCHSLFDRSFRKGGYALGSGNSIPDYIPDENFLAMIKSVETWTGESHEK